MSRFNASYEGIGEMLCMPGLVENMRGRAVRGMEFAQSIAPVGDSSDPHRGRYKEAFRVESGIREGKTRRAFGRIVNDAPEAIDVEYGRGEFTTDRGGHVVVIGRMERHRVLGRALDVMGH